MLLWQKDYDSLKAQMMVSIFSNKFLKLRYVHYLFRQNAIAYLIGYSIVWP